MVLVMILNVKTFICLFFLTLSFPLSASTFEFTKWKIDEFENNRFDFEKTVRDWVDEKKYDIKCSPYHCVALHEGSVWVIGLNNVGQLGLGHTDSVYSWSKTHLTNIDRVSLGFYHSYFLQGNNIYSFGDNRCGQLGNRGVGWSSSPVYYKFTESVKEVSAGGYFGLALLNNGNVYGIGCNNHGQLIKKRDLKIKTWTKLDLKNISKISSGGYHAYAVDNEGQMFGSGSQEFGQLGIYGSNTKGFMKLNIKNITDVSAGAYHGYALTTEKKLLSVGRNNKGQLGYETKRGYSGRWNETLNNVVYVKAGAFHGHAYVEESGLFAVGYNLFEQLGKETVNVKESNWIKIKD
jgi:alpha-tubulin suppressor-like RCC1 family protein